MNETKTNIMTLSHLLQKGNVVSSMVVGELRDRIFKLNGSAFLVEENMTTGEYTISEGTHTVR